MKLGEILGWTKEDDSTKGEKKTPSKENSFISNQAASFAEEIVLELWTSKKGRAGKTALILCVRGDYHESYNKVMEGLLKQLRQTFHCGGSFKDHQIILQYSKREEIKNFFEKKNFQIILCGG